MAWFKYNGGAAWVDDDGTDSLGTVISAARFNNMENGIADALASAMQRQNSVIQGGIVTWDGNNLWWGGTNSRFILISGMAWTANSPLPSNSGYYQMMMPGVGTNIAGHGGVGTTIVTASGISMAAWSSLFYDPIGAVYHIVGYTATFDVPTSWIWLATCSADTTPASVRLCTGDTLRVGDRLDNGRKIDKDAGRVDRYDLSATAQVDMAVDSTVDKLWIIEFELAAAFNSTNYFRLGSSTAAVNEIRKESRNVNTAITESDQASSPAGMRFLNNLAAGGVNQATGRIQIQAVERNSSRVAHGEVAVENSIGSGNTFSTVMRFGWRLPGFGSVSFLRLISDTAAALTGTVWVTRR